MSIKQSPILFFNRDLNISYVLNYDIDEFGEDDNLLYEFICGKDLINFLYYGKNFHANSQDLK